MSNPLVYSRNTDFTSLVDPPNEPQPASLQQEIADSACVAEVDYINTDEVEDDIQVSIYFTTEPSSADETVVDGVVAAHEGIPTTSRLQSKKSLGEDINATNTWVDKLNATTKPVQAGLYTVGCSCEFELENGISSMPPDRAAAARIIFKGTEVAESQWPFSGPHDFCFIGTAKLVEGETPNIQLQFRRVGASDTAKIRRTRVWLEKASGEEEE